jgi:hypothetical protein
MPRKTKADIFIQAWENQTKTISVKHLAQLIDSSVRITRILGSLREYAFIDGSLIRTEGRGKNHTISLYNPKDQPYVTAHHPTRRSRRPR